MRITRFSGQMIEAQRGRFCFSDSLHSMPFNCSQESVPNKMDEGFYSEALDNDPFCILDDEENVIWVD